MGRTGPRRSARMLAVLAIVTGLLPIAGCGITDKIGEVAARIDTAVGAVERESSAWRNELPQLTSDLTAMVQQAQGQLTADEQRIITNSINELGALTQDTVKVAGLTVQQMISDFGTELRCSVDFAKTRVSASLKALADRLRFWKQHRTDPPYPPHSVCQVTPSAIELTAASSGAWTMSFPANRVAGVYGYDFRPDALPTVELRDAAGALLGSTSIGVVYVTRYQLNLNFATEAFAHVASGAQYVLTWPDASETNGIAVTLIQPEQLRITGTGITPAQPRARRDSTLATVTVTNTGGSRSQPSTLEWTPGPGFPVQSAIVPAIGPGDTKTVRVGPYTYPADGTFEWVAVLGSSDVAKDRITVTPYADTPTQLTVPMAGQWPGNGGEPGETRAFDFFVQLRTGCVIDQTRGGGSFTVEDINNPAIRYTIAWPAGYDFGFIDFTFWRSLSSVGGTFDQQATRARGTVTLKGLGSHGTFGSRGPERFNGSFTVYAICPS